MAWIPGGTFAMGAEGFYPEEAPVRKVTVDGFWIDSHPVTNAEYALFVQETGYRTVAERPADQGPPGSMVFVQPPGPVPLRDWRVWWELRPGASWRHPFGPESSIRGKSAHPVVHVAYEDAFAYAKWAGKDLPTEAEWEFAARGGLDGAAYPWGDEPEAGRANIWQGIFPWLDRSEGGHGTSPVGAFAANGYGLFDVVGNVWEWTSDYYRSGNARFDAGDDPLTPVGDVAENPRVDTPAGAAVFASRVLKGGSYLCSIGYDHRFRPAARQPEAIDSGSCHVGFRCVRRQALQAG
ncbi:formylglycine-generating enzyme family protein [Dactylosporangium roseum]|uniref:Formylglycine-generating enzyme family protein n=1 Tax=Dactylosporangium roseum TaxID=47989 RepID=A0ABY5ZDH5_9ACTN|nr:formylglycine-generating enzyme family protein [Dactylosporangium roseum]UWZ40193.1 formylglycine-generating enzyme family protein [Dactylosporangium roseum]